MITFKAIIIPNNRRKDGTYPVKIRVTYKGVSRRLPTTMVCKATDLTRSLKIKSADILNKTDELIGQMRSVVKDISPFELEDKDVDWVVRTIKDTLAGESFHLDFFEWGDRYILTKTDKTREAYSVALNTFERFLGERTIDINDISRSQLLDFMEYVDNLPKMYYNHKTGEVKESKSNKIPRAASTRHIMKLAHIYNAAKDRYNDEDSGKILIPKSPFAKIEKHFPPSQGQKALTLETMQQVISAQVDNENIRLALDAFIVSFGLMGANMADLYNAKPIKETWVYNRRKTMTRREDKAEMRVTIPGVLQPYVERLKGEGGWWLNNLHRMASNKDNASRMVNRYLAKWCEDNGVSEFTFYAARHTWATLAANKAKIDIAVVDRCLIHKDQFTQTETYIEKDWERLNDANLQVLELLTW